MKDKEKKNIEISKLEKTIINLTTPIDVMAIYPLKIMGVKIPKFQEFIDEHGVFRGIYNSKVEDYQRLLNNKKNETIPYKILKMYDETLCGAIMVVTYYSFKK